MTSGDAPSFCCRLIKSWVLSSRRTHHKIPQLYLLLGPEFNLCKNALGQLRESDLHSSLSNKLRERRERQLRIRVRGLEPQRKNGRAQERDEE